MPAPTKFDSLHVKLIEARNIASASKTGSDPYCAVKCSFNKQQFKSKVTKKTVTPKWDQEFAFFTSQLEGTVTVSMKHKDLFSKDELLGEVSFSLKDFTPDELHEKWLHLSSEPQKKKKDRDVQGEIRVEIWFTFQGGPKPTKKAGEKKKRREKRREEGLQSGI